jgi:hypothetical protein
VILSTEVSAILEKDNFPVILTKEGSALEMKHKQMLPRSAPGQAQASA